MAALTTEERLTVLEAEVEKLKQRQESDKSADGPRGWQRIVGIFQDVPEAEFEEMVRVGREWRASEDDKATA